MVDEYWQFHSAQKVLCIIYNIGNLLSVFDDDSFAFLNTIHFSPYGRRSKLRRLQSVTKILRPIHLPPVSVKYGDVTVFGWRCNCIALGRARGTGDIKIGIYCTLSNVLKILTGFDPVQYILWLIAGSWTDY